MASAENTNVGLAKQTAKGAINSTDASFKYFMFNRGGIGVNNQYIPDDDGIGAGSILSGMAKGGVFSAGAFEFVPRSEIIGHFLTGVLGAAAAPVDHPDSDSGHGFKHVITLQSADKFATPYYTFRSKVGGLQAGAARFRESREWCFAALSGSTPCGFHRFMRRNQLSPHRGSIGGGKRR